MLQNPIIKNLFIVLSVFFLLRFLERIWFPLAPTATILACLTAIVLWLHRYDHPRLAGFYRNRAIAPFIDLVCRACELQAPGIGIPARGSAPIANHPTSPRIDPATLNGRQVDRHARDLARPGSKSQTPAVPRDPPLRLRTSSDFARARAELKQAVKGYDEIIDKCLQLLEAAVFLKLGEKNESSHRPLGRFLFAGTRGLGKRSLALEIGSRLFREPSFSSIDLESARDPWERLLTTVRQHPFQAIVLDNFDQAKPEFVRRLSTALDTGLAEGQGPGDIVSFGHCVFFLILNRKSPAIEALTESDDRIALTLAIEAVKSDAQVDEKLAASIDRTFGFKLPNVEVLAQIVAQLMEAECRKFGVTLSQAYPEGIAREVKAIVASGSGLEATPGRIQQILRAPILDATARPDRRVILKSA